MELEELAECLEPYADDAVPPPWGGDASEGSSHQYVVSAPALARGGGGLRGGLDEEGWLAQWAMLARVEPALVQLYLWSASRAPLESTHLSRVPRASRVPRPSR